MWSAWETLSASIDSKSVTDSTLPLPLHLSCLHPHCWTASVSRQRQPSPDLLSFLLHFLRRLQRAPAAWLGLCTFSQRLTNRGHQSPSLSRFKYWNFQQYIFIAETSAGRRSSFIAVRWVHPVICNLNWSRIRLNQVFTSGSIWLSKERI